MPRNIVLCLDGTGNQLGRSGVTNVGRLYGSLEHGDRDRQLTYYDPGLGTFSLQGTWTPVARSWTKVMGLAFGAGLRENVSEAYIFLIRNWRPGDRIFLFGFSRGAYTATVVAGLLRLVGIVRPTAENMVPYFAEMFLRGRFLNNEAGRKRPLENARYFVDPQDDGRLTAKVHFAGLWDTVNAVGLIRRHQMSYTRTLPNVQTVRHAVSIDERRTPYRPHLFHKEGAKEVWFAGVHSDVGGGFDDDDLAMFSFYWMMANAVDAGLLVSRAAASRFQKTQGDPVREDWKEARVDRPVHRAPWVWYLLGERRRAIPPGALVHDSVRQKIEADSSYRPRIPADARWQTTPTDVRYL